MNLDLWVLIDAQRVCSHTMLGWAWFSTVSIALILHLYTVLPKIIFLQPPLTLPIPRYLYRPPCFPFLGSMVLYNRSALNTQRYSNAAFDSRARIPLFGFLCSTPYLFLNLVPPVNKLFNDWVLRHSFGQINVLHHLSCYGSLPSLDYWPRYFKII